MLSTFPRGDRRLRSAGLALVAWLAGIATASAQQTIINVPSDALTPRDRHFGLHESQVNFDKPSGNYVTTNFYTFGLTDRTELAATLYNVESATRSREACLGLGFKSVYPVFRERLPDLEAKFTIGSMTPISLAPSRQAVGFFNYAHTTFEIPETDLRLLAGLAGGSRNLFGRDELSALMGVEYPITEHLSFTGEWFSGTHNLSGLIPGFTYHKGDFIFVAGYKIPNDFRPDGYGIVLEWGLFLGPKKYEKPDEDDDKHYGVRTPRRGFRPRF